MSSVLYMINSGKALELIKKRIEDRKNTHQQVLDFSSELGATYVKTDRFNGILLAVVFDKDVNPDFKKPDRQGASYPKKGTEWDARFKAQVDHGNETSIIAEAFNIPLSIRYTCENGNGWTSVGNAFSECGFLYLGADGPYAMWVPDIKSKISAMEADGRVVDEAVKSFSMEFEGCTAIEDEEWDILVAQHKLAEKRAAPKP